uniref:Uncharacterized protein n=1 Tax=Arundo donax TaxID=35708 RepID=A0A0A9GMR9_ARUDO
MSTKIETSDIPMIIIFHSYDILMSTTFHSSEAPMITNCTRWKIFTEMCKMAWYDHRKFRCSQK